MPVQLIQAMRESAPQSQVSQSSDRVTEVFSGSQNFILVALAAGVTRAGLAWLPLAVAQALYGKQARCRWVFALSSSRSRGYVANASGGAPCSRS